MKYSYTTPSGTVVERKRVQGKDITFVILGLLDIKHIDYRRDKGYKFIRGFADIESAEKALRATLKRDETDLVDYIKNARDMVYSRDTLWPTYHPIDYVIIPVN